MAYGMDMGSFNFGTLKPKDEEEEEAKDSVYVDPGNPPGEEVAPPPGPVDGPSTLPGSGDSGIENPVQTQPQKSLKEEDNIAVGANMGQDSSGYGQTWKGDETYLEPYIKNVLDDVQARGPVDNTSATMEAATVDPATGMKVASVNPIDQYGGATIDPYGYAKNEQMGATPNYGGATVADVMGPTAAQVTGIPSGPQTAVIDPLKAAQAAQLGQFGGPTGATMAGVQGPGVAQIDPQDQRARDAQLQQLTALQAMAGGQTAQSVQNERDRGIQNTLAMMASQRGAPTSAVMRTGMEGMSEVNRNAQEQSAKMQLDALQQLGGAAGQMRGQEIGLAGQQAGFEQQSGLAGFQGDIQASQQNAQMRQQAGLAGYQGDIQQAGTQAGFEQQANMLTAEAERERATQNAQMAQQGYMTGYEGNRQAMMAEAGYGQEAEAQAAGMRQQSAMADAGFKQEAEVAKDNRIADAEKTNATLRQQTSMSNMDGMNKRATEQAQLNQQTGLAGMDVETQAAMADASYLQEANQAVFAADQETKQAQASYQQEANLTNAEMEQAMSIADTQVNAQLEGSRDQLMGALIAQGVDRYKAEMQVNAEIQMQKNALIKDYFAIRTGISAELGVALIGEQWYNESSTEELKENLSVIYALAGQPAPGGDIGSDPDVYDVADAIGAQPWTNATSPFPGDDPNAPGFGAHEDDYDSADENGEWVDGVWVPEEEEEDIDYGESPFGSWL